jgi:hypothetical protein
MQIAISGFVGLAAACFGIVVGVLTAIVVVVKAVVNQLGDGLGVEVIEDKGTLAML